MHELKKETNLNVSPADIEIVSSMHRIIPSQWYSTEFAAASRAVVDAIVNGTGSVGNTPFPAGIDEISEFWGSITKVED